MVRVSASSEGMIVGPGIGYWNRRYPTGEGESGVVVEGRVQVKQECGEG